MNAKNFISGLSASVVIAVLGYFLANAIGLEGLSFAVGSFSGGLLAALLSSRHISRQQPSKAATTKDKIGAGRAATPGRKTLYVGNLAFKADRNALEKLFSEQGKVFNTRIVIDRQTRRPRGYGFVEMEENDAIHAIGALDGETFFGRRLKITEAKEQVN